MSNTISQEELRELIELTTQELGLQTPTVVEKDFYVTQAIHALCSIENDYFRLVFQGGTCLAKAHRLIHRMSEDCDFRIEMNVNTQSLNKKDLRQALKDFRFNIIETLQVAGFSIQQEKIEVRNQSQFVRLFLPYESFYSRNIGIRPDVMLEFTTLNVKLPAQHLPVTSLIKNTLGEKINHAEKLVGCMSVIETAAEKWVALTRRIAVMQHNDIHINDINLVRHLYDLFSIKEHYALEQSFLKLVEQLIQEERTRYKNKNIAYYQNPIQEIRRAIKILEVEPVWRVHWDNFMQTMVFGCDKPIYDVALNSLKEQSEAVIFAIEELFTNSS